MNMRIEAKQYDLMKIIRTVDQFTDKSLGAPPHMSAILINLSSQGHLRFVAENRASAIDYPWPSDAKLATEESGQILVRSQEIKTVLSVVGEEDIIALEYDENDRKIHVHLVNSTKDMQSSIPVISTGGGRVAVPTVGRTSMTDDYVEVGSEELYEAFSIGSGSHDFSGRSPILKSVHCKTSSGLIRMQSINKLSMTYRAVPYLGDTMNGTFEALLDPDTTSSALSLASSGSKVRLHQDESDRLVHIEVLNDEGALLYHIRLNSVAHNISDYPSGEFDKAKQKMKIGNSIVVDKLELLRIMRNCGEFSRTNKAGQEKTIDLVIDQKGMHASVSGDSSYSESVEMKTFSGSPLKLAVKWGLFGHFFTSYPGSEDMKILILHKPLGDGSFKPYAFALCPSDWDVADLTMPDEYIAILPFSNGEYVSGSKERTVEDI